MGTTLDRTTSITYVVEQLERQARRIEGESSRRGWGAETGEICVFPAQHLIDTLLDIRALSADGDTALRTCLDDALNEHAKRPGASTTAEVLELCDRLRRSIG